MTDRTEIRLGGNTFDSRLRDAGFIITTGWDDELKAELVERSLEPSITAMTPRDRRERFPNVDAAQRWFESREKIIYALSSASGLAGVMWFSAESYGDSDLTIALRLYKQAQGRRLAVPFGNTALYHNERWHHYFKDTWLDTSLQNLTAQHTFKNLGYSHHHDDDTLPGRIKMIRPGVESRIRVEMAENTEGEA